MKRFSIGHTVTKDNQHVSFSSVLNMASFCTTECVQVSMYLQNMTLSEKLLFPPITLKLSQFSMPLPPTTHAIPIARLARDENKPCISKIKGNLLLASCALNGSEDKMVVKINAVSIGKLQHPENQYPSYLIACKWA